jgi:glutamate synthase (NADPH/NADH) small chain
MGKTTGFKEFKRKTPAERPVVERIRDCRELYEPFSEEDLVRQSGRCMNCGVPFCHIGCPLGNVIPDWNDLAYRRRWEDALHRLLATNNFPEFTGRLCPAPCEESCVLGLNEPPVTIELIEKSIVEFGFARGLVRADPPVNRTGRSVAVIGSGPAGLACAQQLNRAGHTVTVYERADRIGGLLRYGIPDFKLEKWVIDRRLRLMEAEGVTFAPSSPVGTDAFPVERLKAFDAVALCCGSTRGRDLPIPGRDLAGIHPAMDFLPLQNRIVAGDALAPSISAEGKHVVVIGGGDTGSDCIGTSNRQGAASVTQLEIMPKPPERENKSLTWPDWPLKLRTSSSHQEGVERDFAVATRRAKGENGRVTALECVRLEWTTGEDGRQRMTEIEGSAFDLKADLVFLAMGFVGPRHDGVVAESGVELDPRGNVLADTVSYRTTDPRVFACGDVRRGQSLVVWGIREGRQCARAVDQQLMGTLRLPR